MKTKWIDLLSLLRPPKRISFMDVQVWWTKLESNLKILSIVYFRNFKSLTQKMDKVSLNDHGEIGFLVTN